MRGVSAPFGDISEDGTVDRPTGTGTGSESAGGGDQRSPVSCGQHTGVGGPYSSKQTHTPYWIKEPVTSAEYRLLHFRTLTTYDDATIAFKITKINNASI